jgi:hypothetical protein
MIFNRSNLQFHVKRRRAKKSCQYCQGSPALYPEILLNNPTEILQALRMETQNLIKRTLAQPANLQYLCGLIGTREHTTRKSLATAVCEHFGFYDTRGQAQYAGRIKALRELEAAGHFVLPAVQVQSHKSSPGQMD